MFGAGRLVQQRAADGRRRMVMAVGGWLSAHRALVAAGAALGLTALTGMGGCERGRRGGAAADDGAEMARATRTVDSLARLAWHDELSRRPQPLLDDAGLVALGYVARAEVGVGSPFRLAGFAMRDTRLPVSLGRAAAWAILDRAAHGATYALSAGVLSETPGGPPVFRQIALIDSTVSAAPGARTGEAAVRLGYALAVEEGLVPGFTVGGAVRLAAQARDRRLAREDVARLLRASAADREIDALTLLVRWRAERRFRVEEPLLSDGMRPDDAASVRAALALRDALRAAAARVEQVATADTMDAIEAGRTSGGALRSMLPLRAAHRLADLPSVREGPPQAPVAVAAAAYRRQLLHAPPPAAGGAPAEPGGGAARSAVRRRFAERVRSEETLVAEVAIAAQASGGLPADVAGVAVGAAVGMRAFAQDTVSPLTVEGPTPDVLHARFGLRAVTFDPSVPVRWRPYFLAQLAGALDDVQAVLPWIDFDGLAVRVGESVKRDSALALHDPASRTVYLPAATGAGTIAHELAHDLDWQTARSRLAVRGTYSTDRTMRDGRGGGTLALSVRGLTAARPRSGGTGSPSGVSAERPAELFARGVDWFVATSLAASGRSNGALTAVQDELLAGYAGVVPPEAGDGGADALVGVLGDMTVVPAAARTRLLDRYGMDGAPSAAAIIRLAGGVATRGGTERVLRAYDLVGAPCLATASQASATNWRSVLLRASAESRARGMLRGRARRWTAPARWSWEARAVVGGPWRPALGDSTVARVRDAVLRSVAWEDRARHPFAAGPVAVLAAQAVAGCR